MLHTCPVVSWEDPIPPISFLPVRPAFPSGQSGSRRQYLLLLARRGNGLIVVAPSLPRSLDDHRTELRSHFDGGGGGGGDRKRGGHRSASKKSVTPLRAHQVGDGWTDDMAWEPSREPLT